MSLRPEKRSRPLNSKSTSVFLPDSVIYLGWAYNVRHTSRCCRIISFCSHGHRRCLSRMQPSNAAQMAMLGHVFEKNREVSVPSPRLYMPRSQRFSEMFLSFWQEDPATQTRVQRLRARISLSCTDHDFGVTHLYTLLVRVMLSQNCFFR